MNNKEPRASGTIFSVALVAVLLSASMVYGKQIEVRHQRPVHMNCVAVRQAVAAVGFAQAEQFAAMMGASEDHLRIARSCLK